MAAGDAQGSDGPSLSDMEKAGAGDKVSTTPVIDTSSAMETDGAAAEFGKQELSADDPNLVFWDGPDDPANPMNWPEKKQWLQISLLSIMTVITPLGSSMFAPGIQSIMREFHSSSSITATFLVSIYILGFAFGPLIVAPLSETYGRSRLYQWGNIFFTIFSVGTALSNSIGMLMAFRFLMGLAGAVPITIGAGSIADMVPLEKRARAMSVWAMGPLLGPTIGPVAGGYLIAATSWRWVFWLLTILAGVLIVPSFVLMRETYAPTLLSRKAAHLRKETGNMELRSKLDIGQPGVAEKFKLAILRPFKLLVLTPIVTLMSLYVAVTYGILYLLFTTFSFVYAETYGFTPGTAGLSFLPAGIGMILGVGIFGVLSDKLVVSNKAKGIEHRPEVRISPRFTIPCGIALPLGLFLYGWTTQYAIHWIVPMLGVAVFSAGLMGVMTCIQNCLVDMYIQYAASVVAAITVLRSLAGALLPLGGLQMYNALGLGWGNSLLAFVSLAMVPIPIFFYYYGEQMRRRFAITSL